MATRAVEWAVRLWIIVALGCGNGPASGRYAVRSEAGLAATADATTDISADAGPQTNADTEIDAQSPDAPALVAPEGDQALTAIDGLPLLQLDARSRHASSYDRTGGNMDWGNALGVDSAGDQILLDARGPGCLYRLWFTHFADTDEIHIYFDDEPTARIDMPMAALFGGQTAPFTAPLVGNDQVSSGGFFIETRCAPGNNESNALRQGAYRPNAMLTGA